MKAVEVGQTWTTKKETYAPFVRIVEFSDKRVKFLPNIGERNLSPQQMLVEDFLQLLASGEYECEVPAEKSEKPKHDSVLKLSTTDAGKKYLRTIRSKRQRGPDGKLLTIEVDIYCVIDSYGPFSAAMNHAIKKVLCPGQRGSKDKITDLKEAIVSIQHEIDSEMEIVQSETEPKEETEVPKKIQIPDAIKAEAKRTGWEQIEILGRTYLESGHEFAVFQLEKGSGLRKEKHCIECCQFCSIPLVEYRLNHEPCKDKGTH